MNIEERKAELEAMDDFLINAIVAKILHSWAGVHLNYPKIFVSTASINPCRVDYCNNPADIVPIALDNNIEFWRSSHVSNQKKEFTANLAGLEGHEPCATHANPYRAICIVFILTSEADFKSVTGG